MASITEDLTDLVGNTPIVALNRFAQSNSARILAKLESFNPGSSVKDRIALAMIEQAEKDDLLSAGSTIIEPTSGNTGIGLAMVGKLKGYRVILTMPESMSIERRKLLSSLGAKIILTDAKDGMIGAIREAKQLVAEVDGAFMPGQFDNPANPKAHYDTTGPEIWRDTDGRVDFLVAGVGTGGTLTGAGTYLKEQNPNLKVIAVEPAESAVISGGPIGPHMIQGIGAGFLPGVLDTGIIDETITVHSSDAFDTARALSKEECLLVGISSGAAAYAAREIGSRSENKNSTIVAVLPDGSERYASTLLFYED